MLLLISPFDKSAVFIRPGEHWKTDFQDWYHLEETLEEIIRKTEVDPWDVR